MDGFATCQATPPARTILIGAAEHSATHGSRRVLDARRASPARCYPVDAHWVRGAKRPLEQALEAERRDGFVSLLAANNETGVLAESWMDWPQPSTPSGAQACTWTAVQLPGQGAHGVRTLGGGLGFDLGTQVRRSEGGGSPLERGPTENATPLGSAGAARSGDLRGGYGECGRHRRPGYRRGLGPKEFAQRIPRARATLKRRFAIAWRSGCCAGIPGAYVARPERPERVPNTSFLCLPGLPAEFLLPMIESSGLLASAGSACDASHWKPSPVLARYGRFRARTPRLELAPFPRAPTRPSADVDQAASKSCSKPTTCMAARGGRDELGPTRRNSCPLKPSLRAQIGVGFLAQKAVYG